MTQIAVKTVTQNALDFEEIKNVILKDISDIQSPSQ